MKITLKTLLRSASLLGVLAALPVAAQAASAPYGSSTSSSYGGTSYSGGVQNWGGFYAGIHTGIVWGDFSGHGGSKVGGSGSDDNIMIGGQVGYNWQRDRIVAGAEADLSTLGIGGGDGTGKLSENWSSTWRVRGGYTFGKWLPYGTLGLGLTNTDSKVGGQSVNNTHVGVAVGAGVDYALLDNLSARVEYLYVDVPEESDTIAGRNFNGGAGNNFLRIGANYRF